MLYYSQFKSLFNRTYRVEITIPSVVGQDTELFLGADPFVTQMESGDTMFAPIRTQSATVQIVTKDYLPVLYASDAYHTKVELFEILPSGQKTVVWSGYATPSLYTQGYSLIVDELELECLSPMAILQYLRYPTVTKEITIIELLNEILVKTKAIDYFYFPIHLYARTLSNYPYTVQLLNNVKINTKTFLGDEEQDNWTYKEILEEICMYLSLTAVEVFEENERRVYFIDWDAIKTDNFNQYQRVKVSETGPRTETTRNQRKVHQIIGKDYMSNGTTLSLDNVYNKITVAIDPANIDDEGVDIFDDEVMIPYSTTTIEKPTAEQKKTFNTVFATSDESTVEFVRLINGVYQMGVDSDEGDGKHHSVWQKFYRPNAFFTPYLTDKPSSGFGTDLYADEWPQNRPYSNLFNESMPPEKQYLDLYGKIVSQYNGAVLLKGYSAEYATVELNGGDWEEIKLVPSLALEPQIMVMCHREAKQNIFYSLNPSGTFSKHKTSLEGVKPRNKAFTYKTNISIPNVPTDRYLVLDYKGVYSNMLTRPFKYDGMDDGDDTELHDNFLCFTIEVGDYTLCGPKGATFKFDDGRDTVDGMIQGPGVNKLNGCKSWDGMFAYTGASDGEVSNSGYRWAKTSEFGAQDSFGARHTFNDKVRCYWKDCDNYIGKSMELRTNINYTYGIEATSGVAFKLPPDLPVDCPVTIHLWMPQSPNPNNEIDYLFLTDWSVKIQSKDLSNITGSNNKKTEYSLTIDDTFVNELSEIKHQIATYDHKEPSYSCPIQSENGEKDDYLDGIFNSVLWSEVQNIPTGDTTSQRGGLRPEWYTVYKHYKQYKDPNLILDLTLKNLDDIQMYTLMRSNIKGGTDFVIDSISRNFRADTCDLKMIEKR